MVEVLALTPAVRAARNHWRFRGDTRPDFAEPTALGEESVWDFPRPPRLEEVASRLSVHAPSGALLAETRSARRVLETAGAPTYYFPPMDVSEEALSPLPGRSLCEWKGRAESFSCEGVNPAAWRYVLTFPEFRDIRGWYAFYPGALRCCIDGEPVAPQPGGYYGGWVHGRLRGPIKGGPGTGNW